MSCEAAELRRPPNLVARAGLEASHRLWTCLRVHDSQVTLHEGIAQLEKHAQRLRLDCQIQHAKFASALIPESAPSVRVSVTMMMESPNWKSPRVANVLLGTCLRPSDTLLNCTTLPTSPNSSTWMLEIRVSPGKPWTDRAPVSVSKSDRVLQEVCLTLQMVRLTWRWSAAIKRATSGEQNQ